MTCEVVAQRGCADDSGVGICTEGAEVGAKDLVAAGFVDEESAQVAWANLVLRQTLRPQPVALAHQILTSLTYKNTF